MFKNFSTALSLMIFESQKILSWMSSIHRFLKVAFEENCVPKCNDRNCLCIKETIKSKKSSLQAQNVQRNVGR